jgi:hypothetical protein
VLENLYICKPLSVLYSKTHKNVSRISKMLKLFFEQSRKLKIKNLDLRNEKFKLCFNIGSKWGPRLPEGRGEHVDSVPSLGKWCQGFISDKLIKEKKKRLYKAFENLFKTSYLFETQL